MRREQIDHFLFHPSCVGPENSWNSLEIQILYPEYCPKVILNCNSFTFDCS